MPIVPIMKLICPPLPEWLYPIGNLASRIVTEDARPTVLRAWNGMEVEFNTDAVLSAPLEGLDDVPRKEDTRLEQDESLKGTIC